MGEFLRNVALAESTSFKYQSAWNQWCEFSRAIGWSPWLRAVGRASNQKLGCFAVYCWKCGFNRAQQGNSYGTIKLKLAAVRWFHRRFADMELSDTPEFTLLLQGIRRLSAPARKMQLISLAFLRLLFRSIDISQSRQRLQWGSLLLAYFFLLRRSECLKNGSKRSFYCLKSANIFFSDEQGRQTTPEQAVSVTLGLEGAINDQYGRGVYRTMHKSGDNVICLVKVLIHIQAARRAIGKQRVSVRDLDESTVVEALKSVARIANVPTANYATHSIRFGGATALLNCNADHLSIKLLGRWVSNCYQAYPAQSASATATLSKRMV
ncbi:LOW QUALITY PROTEIN: hypothetical protein PHMEG_0009289 [Phytophthora megakarya]|uniref:Tyr recombinase domain-containing protein n=1 Tax=Phytophthora megakarya TaxID=4795 RepID=A0A225WHI2_9STRA|nr:LOW QUALITY PROTEIN: hypothetical protein PHMEG_0009289 [Phytophthora megakarya]